MIVSLIDIALFLLVLFFLLPSLVYSVYLHAFTKHFHGRVHLHKGDTENPIPR
jgi:hypothetical protein